MEKGKVSIIVPIYNAQDYIGRCIHSLQKQTYNNFECILVDDGSIDKSKKIIDGISRDDSRFIYIYQINRGPSVARNRGMKEASGEYLLCIDADDYVESTYIEKLVSEISQGKDLVCCGYTDVSKYGIVSWNDFIVEDLTKENLIECILLGTGGVLWGKIFRTDIIQKNEIVLDKNLFMCEDMIFVLQYIRYVDRWASINEPLYFYNRLNEKSISRNISDEYLDNYEIFFDRLRKELKKLKVSDGKIKEYCNSKITATLLNLLVNSKDKKLMVFKFRNNDFWLKTLKENSENSILLKLALKDKILLLQLCCFLRNRVHTIGGNIKRFVKRMMK